VCERMCVCVRLSMCMSLCRGYLDSPQHYYIIKAININLFLNTIKLYMFEGILVPPKTTLTTMD